MNISSSLRGQKKGNNMSSFAEVRGLRIFSYEHNITHFYIVFTALVFIEQLQCAKYLIQGEHGSNSNLLDGCRAVTS